MAGITTIIFTNGVVQSTFDNGASADEYSGKLSVLHNIFINIKNKESNLKSVKFYISDDPLCQNVTEVTQAHLEHWLLYIINNHLDNINYIPINNNVGSKLDNLL
jgi:hypothetical protein